MRLLTVLLLCGFLAPVAGVTSYSSHSLAMQATPTPSELAAIAFCPDEQLWRGFTAQEKGWLAIVAEEQGQSDSAETVLEPESELVGVVAAIDIEQPNEAARFTGDLGMAFVTLPPNACRFQSLFYPSAIITVRTGTIEIFVQPGPGGPLDAPLPVGRIWRSDTEFEDLTLPGPIAINKDEWVTLQNRSSVGFRNSSTSEAILLVAANHPPAVHATPTVFYRGCSSGCPSRRP